MKSLNEIKLSIIDELSKNKAYDLPNICSALGLEDGTENEAYNSKRMYVSKRINHLSKVEINKLLYAMKENFDIDLLPEENCNFDNLKKVSEEINSDYINVQIELMKKFQKENPTEAIGKAKELLETICKTILKRLNIEFDESCEIQALAKATYKALKLSPDEVKDGPLSQTIKQILGGLNSISSGLASLRNSYGSGHGKDESYKGLPERYSKLAIGSVSTLVVFLWETMLYQIDKNQE